MYGNKLAEHFYTERYWVYKFLKLPQYRYDTKGDYKPCYLTAEHVAGRLEEVDNLSDKRSGGGVLQLLEGLTRPPQDGHHNVPAPGLRILVQHHLDNSGEIQDNLVNSMHERFRAVFRIRIRIGSGFNQVSGSGSVL